AGDVEAVDVAALEIAAPERGAVRVEVQREPGVFVHHVVGLDHRAGRIEVLDVLQVRYQHAAVAQDAQREGLDERARGEIGSGRAGLDVDSPDVVPLPGVQHGGLIGRQV